MFLSRLRTHPRDLFVLRDLGDATELHRTMMRAFPSHDGDAPRAAMAVLFRVEPRIPGGAPGSTILVQSSVQPDWSLLPEGYLLEHDVRALDDALGGIAAGRRYRFRLVANPSKKTAIPRDGEPRPRNSRRVALLADAERHVWLERKANQAGFLIIGAGSEAGPTISDVDPIGRPRQGGVHVRPARFEGLLEVVDVERSPASSVITPKTA